MARPSRNTDLRLIEAARELLPRAGLSGLSVRAVCRKARVNLGMFHYHFRTKDQFTRRVLQEFYEDFFRGLSLETASAAPPLERLRRALRLIGRFVRANRELLMILVSEALQGNPEVAAFAKANVPRHVAVVLNLVKDCQKAGLIKDVPPPMALAFIMGTLGVPNAVVVILERVRAKRPFGKSMGQVTELMLSDWAIDQRVELALAGLSPRRAR